MIRIVRTGMLLCVGSVFSFTFAAGGHADPNPCPDGTVVELLIRLEDCVGAERIMRNMDMCSRNLYALSPEMCELVATIAGYPGAEKVIEATYCDGDPSRIVRTSVEMIFPVLDILTRISKESRNTRAVLTKLWQVWRTARKTRWEWCLYDLELHDYERMIRVSNMK